MAKNTVLTLKKKVDEGGKVTMVTSYDYTMAALTCLLYTSPSPRDLS